MKSNPNWSFNSQVHQYPVQRTLQFQAVPMWETRKKIDEHCIIELDRQLAKDAAIVKGLIKKEHQLFIQEVLSSFRFKFASEGKKDSIEEYILYSDKETLDDENGNSLDQVIENLKGAVSKAFTSYERDGVKVLSQMNKPQQLLTIILPSRDLSEEERLSLGRVQKFTTFFIDIISRYAAYYDDEEEGHTIPNRLVEDNLPILIENQKKLDRARSVFGESFDELFSDLKEKTGLPVDELMLDKESVARITSQLDIETYNSIVGGLVLDDEKKTKVKGVNENINIYNQVAPKKNRLPKLSPLMKQILTEREPLSWLPQKFEDDAEVVSAIRECVALAREVLSAKAQSRLADFLVTADGRKEGLYIDSKKISEVSHASLGRWDTIKRAVSDFLAETGHIARKRKENDDDFRARIWRGIEHGKSISADLVDRALHWDDPTADRTCLAVLRDIPNLVGEALALASAAEKSLDAFEAKNADAENPSPLNGDQGTVDDIKNFLDTLKGIIRTFRLFTQNGTEGTPDIDFYDLKEEISDRLAYVTGPLYDKTRNYITRRVGSEKLAINASNAILFDGLDVNQEKTKCGVFFKNGESIYAGILIKRNCTRDIPEDQDSTWEKIDFKFLGKAYQMVPKVCISTKKAVERFQPSEEILDLYERRKSLDPAETARLVQYFIDCIRSGKFESWNTYNFTFKRAEEYATLNDLYNEIDQNAFCMNSRRISETWLRERVAEGDILLFEIYNRYMSSGRKGRDDKTKRILRYAFSPENLATCDIRICGGEKLTYREPSIEKRVTHPAGVPMANKNPDNPRETRTLNYDLYKDKRYMEERFLFSIPVILNNNSQDIEAKRVNIRVNNIIRNTPDLNVLGINRGENNLISYAVTAPDGRILEQGHLNTIDGYNYQALLASLERSRTRSRQDWAAIESIRDTKEGYLSLATTEILRLAAKWNCVIAMENMNSDFKERRQRFERNVYQQFERDLCTRLQYCDLEDQPITDGLQLTKGNVSIEDSTGYPQNGILFFVSPWMISRTVPGQPFLPLKYIETDKLGQAKAFFEKIRKVEYNSEDNVFEFTMPESALYNLPDGVEDRDVTICTYGERVVNKTDRTGYGTPVDEVHLLTQEMMKVLQDAGITVSGNMAAAIAEQGRLTFYQQVAGILNLALRSTSLYSAQRVKELRVHGCVRTADGSFYDSRYAPDSMPKDGDALAAWNVARKCLLFLSQIRESDDNFPRLSVSSTDWIDVVRNG